jgi:hypothetical protein
LQILTGGGQNEMIFLRATENKFHYRFAIMLAPARPLAFASHRQVQAHSHAAVTE